VKDLDSVVFLSMVFWRCRSMLEGGGHRQREESRAMGWNTDKEAGMRECRLVVACNKADLLPSQATQGRLEVSPCSHNGCSSRSFDPRHDDTHVATIPTLL